MPAELRVLLAGGGTGGHVLPALAVAETLQARHPGRGRVLFVGSRGGLEQRLVPQSGFQLELLSVGKLKGAGLTQRLRTLAGLPPAGLAALGLLAQFSPDVVVGVGGYASGPMVLAAASRRLPVVLLEQNSVPGMTNRLLSHLARRVVIAFEHASRHFPAGKTLLLGNPIRPRLLEGLRQDRGPATAPCLLVLGGSQGARPLNQLITGAAAGLCGLLPGLRIIHQTGPADLDQVRQRYREAGVEARVEAFIEDMAAVYRQADLALCRAGATTIAELCVAGLPALLVPYPFAADDHQALNAREMVRAGGALMRRQQALTPGEVGRLVSWMLADRERLGRMSQAARGCGRPDAAERVLDLLQEVCGWS